MSTLAPARTSTLFNLDAATFRYEPFPIGVARPAFEADVYEEMVDNWPAQELFAYMPKLGRKFSLAEINNASNYHEFVEKTPIWKRLHREIKSQSFVRSMIQCLKGQHIDLGIQ